ncbi:prolyl oligopeptidase family serine peptidase [Zavarzinella formosa]|uniref:prolyl oligopeptidase family serine peptidase n=1 Tax=Zavarzinella formosa TaxID=360055 RepID=UPI00038090D4|nr:prolyl oligopeptidase family serine peptidase [Zavarzinella formosa]
MRWICFLLLFGSLGLTAMADGPADNVAEKVRPVPPTPKDPVPPEEMIELQKGVSALGAEIEGLKTALKDKPELLALLPDVIVYYKGVHDALKYNEVFDPKKEVPTAKKQLQIGMDRAKALREGKAPWMTQTGNVIHGYVSKIDGSIQPYGLFVPTGYDFKGMAKHRLDVWCHGRGETLSELNFNQGGPGWSGNAKTFILSLYGRYCCANKFAGEIDCFEALDAVKKNYRVDEDRVVMRGFSMGGAACWQFAVHYPSVWCAAAPGAGFSETADFLKVFQKETVKPRPDEKKLWHMYDCTDYALNLTNLPTVAYSGEIDSQKQAADMMEKALKDEGMTLIHLIGPKTAHSYHPEVRKELNKQIDALAEKGRPAVPPLVKFTTWTLRYPTSYWVTIAGMEQHWERAKVVAEILDKTNVKVTTSGVTDLTLAMPAGHNPFDSSKPTTITIDGKAISVPATMKFVVNLSKTADGWKAVDAFSTDLHKRPGLQGPIDDAFLDSFVMVKPTGKPMNEAVGKWAAGEMTHATIHWRNQFRGEAPVKADTDVTDADIAASNLILWGDPSSNAVLKKIADKLPVKWTESGVIVGGKTYAGGTHVPVLIYPNPLNPKKYVVLNSGFTFREYDYLNNARQISKLPDYAVIDITSPVTPRFPGKVEAAGFFDEKWMLPTGGK